MNTWTDWDGKRLRAAAEHQGVTAFADLSARDVLRVVFALCAALSVHGRRRRYQKTLRRRYARR